MQEFPSSRSAFPSPPPRPFPYFSLYKQADFELKRDTSKKGPRFFRGIRRKGTGVHASDIVKHSSKLGEKKRKGEIRGGRERNGENFIPIDWSVDGIDLYLYANKSRGNVYNESNKETYLQKKKKK